MAAQATCGILIAMAASTGPIAASLGQLRPLVKVALPISHGDDEPPYVLRVAVSKSGTYVATAASDGVVRVYAAGSLALLGSVALGDGKSVALRDIAWREPADGSASLLVGTDMGRLHLLNAPSCAVLASWLVPIPVEKPSKATDDSDYGIYAVAVSPSGDLAAVSVVSQVLFFTLARNPPALLGSYVETHTEVVTQLMFHPTLPHHLLTGGDDGLLCLIDTSIKGEEDSLVTVCNAEAAVAHFGLFGAHGQLAWIATRSLTLSVWDLGAGVQVARFDALPMTFLEGGLCISELLACSHLPLEDSGSSSASGSGSSSSSGSSGAAAVGGAGAGPAAATGGSSTEGGCSAVQLLTSSGEGELHVWRVQPPAGSSFEAAAEAAAVASGAEPSAPLGGAGGASSSAPACPAAAPAATHAALAAAAAASAAAGAAAGLVSYSTRATAGFSITPALQLPAAHSACLRSIEWVRVAAAPPCSAAAAGSSGSAPLPAAASVGLIAFTGGEDGQLVQWSDDAASAILAGAAAGSVAALTWRRGLSDFAAPADAPSAASSAAAAIASSDAAAFASRSGARPVSPPATNGSGTAAAAFLFGEDNAGDGTAVDAATARALQVRTGEDGAGAGTGAAASRRLGLMDDDDGLGLDEHDTELGRAAAELRRAHATGGRANPFASSRRGGGAGKRR